MALKQFILGLPGSGKSTTSRYIDDYVKKQHKDWSTKPINDYDILYNMFLKDTKGKFRSTNHKGFNVYDLSVFDTALWEMETIVLGHLQTAKKNTELIILEFARNDYSQAFKQFSPDFLQNAYFLFLDTNIDICKERIRERVANPKTEDDHFVSEYIFDAYYNKDNRQYLSSNLKTDYGIDDQKIKVIENNGLFQAIVEEINQFVDFIFKQESGNLFATNS